MNRLHRYASLLLALLFAGLLLVAATTLTACGSGETPAENAGQHDDEGHDEEQLVHLTAEELQEFGIEIHTARPGVLEVTATFSGEVQVNPERYARIMPRVSGVVHTVHKSVGDRVQAGEVMAMLESRELANAKAEYLAARERKELDQASFSREERLYKRKISSEQEYLEARRALAEADILLQSAIQKLRALGFSEAYIAALSAASTGSFIQYPLTAPFDGEVVERHITQGEMLEADAPAFEIADLSQVWVELEVYQKDLALVREGQEVIISAGFGLSEARGVISYVRPIVGEETRTARTRIVLPNPNGVWRPGLFVKGSVVVRRIEAPVLVPKTALQTIDEQPVVFVKTTEGFEPRHIVLGQENETQVAVLSGLASGEEYVAVGGFALKTELAKSSFGGDED